MDQLIDRPTLINMALAQLGQPPRFISSNDEGDSEDAFSGTIDRMYRLCLDECYSKHDWSFLRVRTSLVRHAAQPTTGFRYRFDLPGDRLGPITGLFVPGYDAPVREFIIQSDTLDCNEPIVSARYKADLDPQYWDAGFRHAFVVALASQLAVPLQQDLEMRNFYYQEAFGRTSEQGSGGLFGRLIAQDRASSPLGSPITEHTFITDHHW